ncbi:hypothetical protein FRACYDRAFT_263081 [Fragilariopsis cylindrus CCMP1102]|uniref:Uncharacterized protein n=1 Tax=Fragilariopsis cylindrus CCMP1102 TaxID=635003 RepID=A0A1E7F431_9STRA|nr:hypothetical protein FRACYDRAFT_263081 [Fragilariopsis cylindrus CCMP1102]|eukprot:OEU12899.1 hypothetical protein FRACYDRAFT_263081 [Fragilariopsis cylindrus CCMP1102]
MKDQDQQLPHEVHEHIDVITNLVTKTIALNHDGVICLESNKIKSAIKIFTTAYNTHEKIKIKMNMKKYATAAVPVAVSPAPPTPSNSYHNNNVNELFYQYRRAPSSSSSSVPSSESVSSSSSSSSSSVDESSSSLSYMPSLDEVTDSDMDCNDTDILRIVSDNNIHRIDLEEAPAPAAALSATVSNPVLDIEDEIIFRDSIRLPFYEDIFPTTFEAALQDQEQHPAFSFLSTCHALNLAIAHHLRGIELLKTVQQQQKHQQRRIVSNVSTDSDSNETGNRTGRRRSGASEEYIKHFDKACRLYEQTMSIERTRSKFNDQQDSTQASSSSSSSWFSPQILLACLNNLGHIHSLLSSSSSSSRSQEQEQCHQYYNRLQLTVRNLVISTMSSTSSASSLARRSMQMSRSMPWMNLIREVDEEEGNSNYGDTTSNDIDTTRNDIDMEDTYTYLELFWTNSFHGLNRLSTAITASSQQQQQNVHRHNNVHSRNDKSTPRSTSMPSSTASVSTTSSVSSTSVSSTPRSITIPKRAGTAAAASVAA